MTCDRPCDVNILENVCWQGFNCIIFVTDRGDMTSAFFTWLSTKDARLLTYIMSFCQMLTLTISHASFVCTAQHHLAVVVVAAVRVLWFSHWCTSVFTIFKEDAFYLLLHVESDITKLCTIWLPQILNTLMRLFWIVWTSLYIDVKIGVH